MRHMLSCNIEQYLLEALLNEHSVDLPGRCAAEADSCYIPYIGDSESLPPVYLEFSDITE